MEKFSPESKLEEISQMTQKITADKRLAGSEDFETIKQIADEYEILKSEMRKNSQTKMLVLNASVTKFLQQELSDFEKNGTALSTEHDRALKKLERALDFNQDFNREYERKNTRIGDGAFRNFFKSDARRDADRQKVHELEMQNNQIDAFVFEANSVAKTVQENIEIGLKNIREKIAKISQDGKLGGTEDFKEIKEMTRFFDDAKKSEIFEKFSNSEEVAYLRAMMLEIWKNKAYYTDEHFRYLWKFEESLYQNKDEMPVAERRNQIISALFSSDARDRADEKREAYEKELSHNVISPFTPKSENTPKTSENLTTNLNSPATQNQEKTQNSNVWTEKIAENSGTLNFLDKELPTETDKIVFLQLGLNYFNKTNSLKIDGTRNTETEAAMQKFQADFDKKFPNAYKNPNENPFERTIHNLWFELSQAGFDTIKIIDESLRKSKTIPKQSQTTNAQTVAPKKENPSEMSQNTQKTPEVKQTKDNSNENTESIPDKNVMYLQFAMYHLLEKFPDLKGKSIIANGISDENFVENLKILQKNLGVEMSGKIDQATLQGTEKAMDPTRNTITLEDINNSGLFENKIDNTETQKPKFSPTQLEIQNWSKNPLEIPNETVRNLYIQHALNIVKNNISETGAKALIAGQKDLELTGKMDDRTTKAIEAFQKYINHYQYHTPNEPLEVTGKLNIKTMEVLVARVNLTGNSQSEEIVRKSLQDIQK